MLFEKYLRSVIARASCLSVFLLASVGSASAATLSFDGAFNDSLPESFLVNVANDDTALTLTRNSTGSDFANISAFQSSGAQVIGFFFPGGQAGSPAAVEQFTLDLAGTYTFVVTGGNSTGTYSYDLTGAGITAVPLPAAAWLFLSAVGGLFAVRRRSQRSVSPTHASAVLAS